MSTQAITYRTGAGARALRTVYVTDVRESAVLAPGGLVDVVIGKLTHGSTCAHEFWHKVLGTSGDDFLVPAAQVVARRSMDLLSKPKFRGTVGPDGRLTFRQACDA